MRETREDRETSKTRTEKEREKKRLVWNNTGENLLVSYAELGIVTRNVMRRADSHAAERRLHCDKQSQATEEKKSRQRQRRTRQEIDGRKLTLEGKTVCARCPVSHLLSLLEQLHTHLSLFFSSGALRKPLSLSMSTRAPTLAASSSFN